MLIIDLCDIIEKGEHMSKKTFQTFDEARFIYGYYSDYLTEEEYNNNEEEADARINIDGKIIYVIQD